MAFMSWMSALLYYFGFEFVAFVLVDKIAKATLKEAEDEQSKRTIWLYESAGLCVLCLLLSSVHQVPYLLILLTGVTFVYTQMLGPAGLSNILTSLRAHWDNHLQHEDNMKQIEKQRQQQQQLQQQALGMAGLNHNTVADLNNSFNAHQQQQGYNFNVPFFNKQGQGNLHYPPNATVVPGQDRPTYSMSPNSVSYQDAVKQGKGLINSVSASQNWNMTNSNTKSDTHQFMSGFGRSQYDSGVASLQQSSDLSDRRTGLPLANLQRKSLRPDMSSKTLPQPLSSSAAGSIKSKFMNAIGFGPSAPKPVGLVNNGRNMCFINSVIQCLARGPFLVESLTADAIKELECTVAESELLSSLSELFHILRLDTVSADCKMFDAKRFRKAASVLNSRLVTATAPGETMEQQDVAEFLMWLLATVHVILNKNRLALERDRSNFSSEERFSSPRLAQLKLIYGDLNVQRIKDLKDQCRREIAAANGLENESYAEAVQRLSDLEWLTHKQSNDTIVDGLFTGQLVEAILEGGHISVNLQPFNVLPVPIAAPRTDSGLVMLEDCFTNFCNIENLNEVMHQAGSLEQSPVIQITNIPRQRCNFATRNDFVGSGTPVTRKSLRLLQQEAGIPHLPSPIQQGCSPATSVVKSAHMTPGLSVGHLETRVGESGFTDSNTVFRTSTPIGIETLSNVPSQMSTRQRRCLLRQLPECLIIQLLRYKYDQSTQSAIKVNTSVSIRLRSFNLQEVIYDTVTQRSDLTAQTGGYIYELYGLCLHLGAHNTSNGHYVSYCLDGDKWYRMDDETVEEVNIEYHLGTEEIRQNAYLLFYRKMSQDSV